MSRLQASDFPPVKISAIGLVWLAAFSLLYTIGSESGAWPKLPLGGLRDLDLFAGFAAGLAALVSLFWGGRDQPIG